MVEMTKTEAHMFYNAGKGGADAFDQRCSVTSCRRKTRCWSLSLFYQTVNIAMNNAWILYRESDISRERANDQKAEYLHEIAYRISRPFAVDKYQRTNRRHMEVKTMIDMVFKLDTQEKAGAPAMAPVPDVAPADAAAVAPVPAVAPADAPHAPADAPAPAQAAAAERHYMVPAAVAGATRDVPTEAQQPAIPFLGEKWTSVERKRCSLCSRNFHFRGRYKCEMPECGHRDMCIHHSVNLCQNCFHGNNKN